MITTGELVEDADLGLVLRRVAGERGTGRPIRHPRIQKSGLALAGHAYGVVPARVQILGETEISYLDTLSAEARSEAAWSFFSLGLSCVIVTANREPPRAMVAAAEATGTPLYVSESRSSHTINALHSVLDDRLAPQTTLHGVLLDVFGIGVLLLGKSGIGKSECALELVLRGHRLVADDIVQCDWRPPGVVFGAAAHLLRHHIEARGLGVLNVKALFGVTSVRDRKVIDIVIRLVEWDGAAQYDRLGIEDSFYTILDTPIREFTIPVRPGRDMGSILEIAARNELLRRSGSHAAREFAGRIEQHLVTKDPRVEADRPRDFRAEIDPAPAPTQDSVAVPPAAHSPPPPRPVSPTPPAVQVAHHPQATGKHGLTPQPSAPSSGESSAWIPAAKAPKEEP
jgi:HPr kinase/phosphorylase